MSTKWSFQKQNDDFKRIVHEVGKKEKTSWQFFIFSIFGGVLEYLWSCSYGGFASVYQPGYCGHNKTDKFTSFHLGKLMLLIFVYFLYTEGTEL